MKKSHLFGAVCACLFSLCSHTSHAASVTIGFTAEFDYHNTGAEILADYFGPTMSGTFTYDTDTAVSNFDDSNPAYTSTTYANAINNFTLSSYDPSSGFSLSISGNTGDILIRDGLTSGVNDRFSIINAPGTSNIPGYENIIFNSDLLFNTVTVFSSGALPSDASFWPGVSGTSWTNTDVYVDTGTGYLETEYDINNLYDVASVPLPAAAWLFGSGLLGLVGMARRKKA